MIFHRIKTLGAYLFLIVIGIYFIISPALAASRGILVKTKTSTGSTRQIQLYSEYYALVVGSGEYTNGWPRLPNPVKDAKEIASLLKDMGWRVDVLMNPAGAKLRRELNKLVTGVGRNKDKAILLWFSGHGQTIEEADGTKLGYLVPVDAPDPDRDMLGFMERAISMRQIETVSKQIRSKHVLMAFDSCFSGAIFQMVRSKPSLYIQQKVTYPVRQFITAGGEDEQVPDKSVFKEVFIQGIKDGFADLNQDTYVTGEELGAYLQERVTNYSRNAQHPQFGKINNPRLDKGDFVFVLKSPKPPDPSKTDLEAERRRLELEKQAVIENQRREPGIQPQEDKKLKLASIPEEVQKAKIALRKAPRQLKERDIKKILVKNHFFDAGRNPSGNFANDFIAKPDGTVTDKVTGLMWQKSGSSKDLERGEAQRYVKKLNQETFSGYSDWRMPTIEELSSLMIRTKKNGLYIDSVFDSRQTRCWSADSKPRDLTDYYYKDWIINFFTGHITISDTTRGRHQYTGMYWGGKNRTNYVRAVRSLE